MNQNENEMEIRIPVNVKTSKCKRIKNKKFIFRRQCLNDFNSMHEHQSIDLFPMNAFISDNFQYKGTRLNELNVCVCNKVIHSTEFVQQFRFESDQGVFMQSANVFWITHISFETHIPQPNIGSCLPKIQYQHL